MRYTHTHTHHVFCLYKIILYLPSYHILNPLVNFFCLGSSFIRFLFHFIDSGGALCLSHWCDLLLGFSAHGWEDRWVTPVETQRDLKDSKVLWFQWIFFDVFFCSSFSTIGTCDLVAWDFWWVCFDQIVMLNSWSWQGHEDRWGFNKVVMQWVFDELEWNVWSPGVWKIRSNGEKTPSLQRESGVVKKIHVGLYASPNVFDTQNTASSIGGRNSF